MMQAPQAWIKTLTNALEDVKEIPLWGNPPSVDWEKLSHAIQTELGLTDLQISFHKMDQTKDPLAGYGKDPHIAPIELTPLLEKAYWIMSRKDVAELTKVALSSKKPTKGLSDPLFQEGFYLFLLSNAILSLSSLNLFDDLSLTLASHKPLSQEEGFAIDLAITLQGETFRGRIFCPIPFYKTFHDHFASKPFSLESSPLLHTLDVELILKIGSVTLSLPEWDKVQQGDLILLENCSFDPEKRKGTLSINLGNTSLFQGSYKDGVAKIHDYAFYYEGEENMEENNSNEEIEKNAENEEKRPSDTQNTEEESTEEHLWETPEGAELPIEKSISRHDVPIALTVEIGRLHMHLEKLLQLQPGNVLELSKRAELGVDLTINGKKVAKAEVVKIGAAYGLKILQIN